ncbi:Arm DNA-binding domain-containing protein [Priestia megaterium]|uniref:Arm DNA-binding domain-containing protein n=1 Tax=Priestia megaterium TaxID=1404 RepID=UPI00286CBADD|nr:Arm DNA-binding domain-containing protein [Priestia megaterium]
MRYVDPTSGKTKEISKGGFRTKSEAKLAAGELEKQIYLGKHSLLENREKLIKIGLTNGSRYMVVRFSYEH